MDFDFNAITNAISTIGFPIACVVFLWKYINTTMREFTDAINANTQMLTRISAKLDALDGGDNK